MQRIFSFLLTLSLFISLFSLTPATYAQTVNPKQEYTVSKYEQEVINLVNEERKKRNLDPLKLDIKLSQLARQKSEDMRDKNYFDHTSPTYGKPCDHMKKEGVDYRYCGENIGAGYKTPEEAMDGWMKSEPHRENILSPNYTHIGVGYAEGGGEYGTYWTQQFKG
ncbi:CAP domain-containing protein [Shimazuella soli]|uniref:CAP domain-containing protein n=1 Tax=Shimazuella soli TaxID=1892854 RepID=UPI003B83277B